MGVNYRGKKFYNIDTWAEFSTLKVATCTELAMLASNQRSSLFSSKHGDEKAYDLGCRTSVESGISRLNLNHLRSVGEIYQGAML
jgi:hypothetical protein